jgi:hypothetical protein
MESSGLISDRHVGVGDPIRATSDEKGQPASEDAIRAALATATR